MTITRTLSRRLFDSECHRVTFIPLFQSILDSITAPLAEEHIIIICFWYYVLTYDRESPT